MNDVVGRPNSTYVWGGGCGSTLQVSWNVDCLSGENKMARVEEVCAIVLETEPTPDVILLQVRVYGVLYWSTIS